MSREILRGVADTSRTAVNKTDGSELVLVPAGTFLMGSDEARTIAFWRAHEWDRRWLDSQVVAAGELRQHEVELDGFWMYRELVTIGQYHRFMLDTGHPAPVDPQIHGPWNSAWSGGAPIPGSEMLPVSSVSWADAAAYAARAEARLPTEAEWEYAACGTADSVFPWGEEWDATAARCAESVAGRPFTDNDEWRIWLNGGGSRFEGGFPPGSWLADHVPQLAGPTAADTYPADLSWCGVHGLAGQVREWCSDWFVPDYYERSPHRNPRGPESPNSYGCRSMRGGSWLSPAYTSRCAQRLFYPPDSRDTNDHGFRCVISG